MKKKLLIFLLVFTAICFTSCGNKEDDKFSKKINVNIEVEKYGTISLELYPDVAPITVDNFVSLIKDGFYDGTTFHRIMPGFMIQGGDPTGTGKGGSSHTIKGEFLRNGYDNILRHERGVISMSRNDVSYDSASSQFFIMHATDNSLDGNYAAFGKVTSGIEVVDKICENTPTENSNGKVLPENQPKITRIYIVE